jgi:hypothetical protein
MHCPPIKPKLIVVFLKHEEGVGGVNLGFRELGIDSTMLIDDYLYKCMGNVPYSYILPKTFDSEAEDNYILDTLWPWWGYMKLQAS